MLFPREAGNWGAPLALPPAKTGHLEAASEVTLADEPWSSVIDAVLERGHLETDTWGEGHVKMGADMGGSGSKPANTKDSQEPTEAEMPPGKSHSVLSGSLRLCCFNGLIIRACVFLNNFRNNNY